MEFLSRSWKVMEFYVGKCVCSEVPTVLDGMVGLWYGIFIFHRLYKVISKKIASEMST